MRSMGGSVMKPIAQPPQRPKATEEEYKAAWDRLVAATGTDSTDAMLMKHVDATASR